MNRNFLSISPEAVVLAIGLGGITLSEITSAAESIPTAVSMGTVVLALLGFVHLYQKQSATREAVLMDRVAKLEDLNQDKLHNLIERQLQAAVKQDAMLLQMSETLVRLTDGQKGMHAIISRFASERPCLLTDQINKEHKHDH